MPKRYIGLNPANLSIYSSFQHKLHFLAQSEECYKCPLMFIKSIIPFKWTHIRMNTTYNTIVNLEWNSKTICHVDHLFEENTHYTWNITQTNCGEIQYNTPHNIYMPILWLAITLLVIALTCCLGNFLSKFYASTIDAQSLIASDLGSVDDETPIGHHVSGSLDSSLNLMPRSRRRLKSLDTFRGISLVLMIFVNYGGGQYYFFTHSPWNGLTFADLVFPWFIWIMGVSMVLSFHSLLRRAVSKKRILFKICSRAFILFFLGLIINGRKDYTFDDFRIFGVLQRIAVCYLLVGCCDILATQTNDVHLHLGSERPWWSRVRDIVLSWPQWIVALIFVTIHTILTFKLPVPGCPQGYVGPGGLADNVTHWNCTGGAAGYIDKVILSYNHMYKTPTCKTIYDTQVPYDPEGILGIFTASFLVFLGLQAGKTLVFFDNHFSRIYRWFTWSLLTGTIGLVLCKASKNDGWIPVNKNLWSLSFVLALAGTAFLLLCFLYLITDWLQIWSGAPFSYAGMNSILLYVGHEFTTGVFPWGWTCPPSHACYLFEAAWGAALWVIISIYMYHKKFFLII